MKKILVQLLVSCLLVFAFALVVSVDTDDFRFGIWNFVCIYKSETVVEKTMFVEKSQDGTWGNFVNRRIARCEVFYGRIVVKYNGISCDTLKYGRTIGGVFDYIKVKRQTHASYNDIMEFGNNQPPLPGAGKMSEIVMRRSAVLYEKY